MLPDVYTICYCGRYVNAHRVTEGFMLQHNRRKSSSQLDVHDYEFTWLVGTQRNLFGSNQCDRDVPIMDTNLTVNDVNNRVQHSDSAIFDNARQAVCCSNKGGNKR